MSEQSNGPKPDHKHTYSTPTDLFVVQASETFTFDPTDTLAVWLIGRRRARMLRQWWEAYHGRFEWTYRISLAITCMCWFLSDTTAAGHIQAACLLVSSPLITFRFLFMCRPLLRILFSHYEFCFTTALNLVGSVLFGMILGDSRAVSCVFAFFSHQTTVCIDATVYNITPAARSSAIHFVCLVAIYAFAIVETIKVREIGESQRRSDLVKLNLLVNLTSTLGVFVANKSFKRKKCLSASILKRDHLVPLGICFTRLAVQRKDTEIRPGQKKNSNASNTSPITRAPLHTTHSQTALQLVPVRLTGFDSFNTLMPGLNTEQPISILTLCVLRLIGLCGLGCTMFTFSVALLGERVDQQLLWFTSIMSLVASSAYVGTFFVHLHRDLVNEIVTKFDFWFFMFQCITLNLCLADMTSWDIRSLSLIAWSIWLLWILLQDGMTPQTRARLRYQKRHAMLLLMFLLSAIGIFLYKAFVAPDSIIEGRNITIMHVSPSFSLSFNTKSFALHRLWTILLWTLRLVNALSFHRDDELVMIKGSLQYFSRWYTYNIESVVFVASPRDNSTH